MSFPNPGKTAPCLIEDLYNYDPRQRAHFGRNVLAEPPPHHDPNKSFAEYPPIPPNCRHHLVLKPDQCVFPENWDTRTTGSTVYKIASMCRLCRHHFAVTLDFRGTNCRNPCPNEENKLHHFQCRGDSTREYDAPQDAPQERYLFQCSSLECNAWIKIEVLRPRLDKAEINLLSNQEVLEQRLQKAKRLDPGRDELQVARSIDGFYILYAYIKDALTSDTPRSIPVRNRKFLVTYGEDCDQILERLGFSKHAAETDGGFWHLPSPTSDWDRLKGDDLRDNLDDTMYELGSFMDLYPKWLRDECKRYSPSSTPARDFIERVLGCFNLPKHTIAARKTAAIHPYYIGLGALDTFADSLVIFAHSRQVQVDVRNKSYYLECLQEIAKTRESEELMTQCAVEESTGTVSRKDVAEALKYFDFDIADVDKLEATHIIGSFRARLSDIPARQVPEARQMLAKIGSYKDDKDIFDAANDSIESYDQAISYLGISSDTPDDFVASTATVKQSEDPSESERVTQAVKLIAEHRQSTSLFSFITTGDMSSTDDAETEKAKAYSAFGLENHKGGIDLETLEIQLSSSKEAEPSRSAELDRYATIIRNDIQGSTSAPPPPPRHPPETWPVGIENLGNTCYLNAILQYLFTVKPLRELVLNIEDHLMEVTPENVDKKKIGGRKVTAEEVHRSQTFVRELKELFLALIVTPSATFRPRYELVEHALQTANADETTQISDTDDKKPEMDKPSTESSTEKTEKTSENDKAGSDSSEATLVGDGDKDPEKLPDADDGTNVKEGNDAEIPPPDHPPPVPPRTQPSPAPKVSYTMQQDASEILNNILTHLSNAMRPERVDEDGEQIDLVKQLFFGKERAFKRIKGETTGHVLLFNAQNITVVDRPKHVYDALDDLMDKNIVEGSEKTEEWSAITELPPILKLDVKRLGFDREKAQTTRSEHHLALDDTIYMERYLDNETVMEKRQISWERKARVKALKERREKLVSTQVNLRLPDALLATSEYLSDLDDSRDCSIPAVKEKLNIRAKNLDHEIGRVDRRIAQIEQENASLFADLKQHPYRLHSLFIHRGSTGGGHYLVSIRDFKNDIWRNYNDETVTEVTDVEKNIFGEGEPYSKIITTCVVYVRADLKFGERDLVEAICREPRPEPEPASTDVEMTSFKDDWTNLPVTEGVEVNDQSQNTDGWQSTTGYENDSVGADKKNGAW
ncbi:hypothetical protein BC567DRAFT_259913 [Phyllosticta citribraziliensis]